MITVETFDNDKEHLLVTFSYEDEDGEEFSSVELVKLEHIQRRIMDFYSISPMKAVDNGRKVTEIKPARD